MSHRLSSALALISTSIAVALSIGLLPTINSSKPPAEGDARTPIDHLPFLIQESGSYVVTDDLRGLAGSSGIRIGARDVTIDLNGFTLRGVPGSLDAIESSAENRIVIRNGTIRDWGGSGVAAANGAVWIRDVSVSGCGGDGIHVGANSRVEATTVSACGQSGIKVGDNSFVESCLMTDNALVGIETERSCFVRQVQAIANLDTGFIAGPQTELRECLSRANVGNGIELDSASTAISCRSFGNAEGIVTGVASIVRECYSRKNEANGILVDKDGVIYDNAFEGNGLAAIYVLGNKNHLERNRMFRHDVGVDIDGKENVLIRTFSHENVSDYEISDDNYYQTIQNPQDKFNDIDPWGNFNFLEED